MPLKRDGFAVMVTTDTNLQYQQNLRARRIAATKKFVSVRNSQEVPSYFKATGEGWQSRMHGPLREYVSRRTHRA